MLLKEIKDVLFYHYKNDVVFPRSCSSVSMTLAYLLELSEVSSSYEVYYKRGHYRNDNEEEDIYCHELEGEYRRGCSMKTFPCLNCNCDYMVGHSWIELVSKTDRETIILDFTSIQFEPDFVDYHSDLLESDHNKDSLYKYLVARSKFIVEESDYQFSRYINSGHTHTGECLVETVKELIEGEEDSDLTLILKALGYLQTT